MDSIPSRRQQHWGFRPSHDHLSLLALPCATLGLLPLFGRAPTTGWRVITIVTFLGIAVVLWLRRSAAAVSWDGHTLRRGWSRRDPRQATAIRLAEAGARQTARPYLAWLEFGAERWLVAEDADPARVFAHLVGLASAVNVPICLGWGLPEAASASLQNLGSCPDTTPRTSSEQPQPPLETSWPEQPQQRQSALAIALCGASSCSVLAFVLVGRLRQGLVVPLPSVLLTLGFLTLFALLALAARGSEWRASVGVEIVLTRRDWLGRRTLLHHGFGRGFAAYLASASDLRHLLLFSGASVVAVPICGVDAERFVEALIQRGCAASLDEERCTPTRSDLPRTRPRPSLRTHD